MVEFKDTFEALFHNNVGLSDIQKFHYLRSCLGDESLKIIPSLDFAAQNYKNAWELLCDSLSKESSSDLRKLIDTINKHLRALKTLQLPTEHWDPILINMVSLKLDKNTNRKWEQTRTDKKLPILTNFFSFVQNRADFLETLEMNNFQKKSVMRSEPKGKQRHYSLLLSDNKKRQDSRCNFRKLQQHLIYACDKFLKLSISERWNHVKKLGICSNCLHDILVANMVQAVASSVQNSNYILLSTPVVYVQNKDGHFHKANAVLDSGSQCSFISESFCSKVGSVLQNVKMCVSGINNSTASTIIIKSTISPFKKNIACSVVPKITDNLHSYSIDTSGWSIPSDIPLAT
ncbi:hypothetical protein D910_09016, partial [Dendroctonus ponderosae]